MSWILVMILLQFSTFLMQREFPTIGRERVLLPTKFAYTVDVEITLQMYAFKSMDIHQASNPKSAMPNHILMTLINGFQHLSSLETLTFFVFRAQVFLRKHVAFFSEINQIWYMFSTWVIARTQSPQVS